MNDAIVIFQRYQRTASTNINQHQPVRSYFHRRAQGMKKLIMWDVQLILMEDTTFSILTVSYGHYGR